MKTAKVAGKVPQMEQLENQPWCNGAHSGSEFAPKIIKAEESKTAALCMCKQSKNLPYCNGVHMSL